MGGEVGWGGKEGSGYLSTNPSFFVFVFGRLKEKLLEAEQKGVKLHHENFDEAIKLKLEEDVRALERELERSSKTLFKMKLENEKAFMRLSEEYEAYRKKVEAESPHASTLSERHTPPPDPELIEARVQNLEDENAKLSKEFEVLPCIPKPSPTYIYLYLCGVPPSNILLSNIAVSKTIPSRRKHLEVKTGRSAESSGARKTGTRGP